MKNLVLVMLILVGIALKGIGQNAQNTYHTPEEIQKILQEAAKEHPKESKLHLLGKTYSGLPVQLIEIGPETAAPTKKLPAIFVAANFEGTNPLAPEAALHLIRDLFSHPEYYQNRTWYILPQGNPEGAGHFFASPQMVDARNTRPFNDDMDDQTDEDPCEDLNGDGWITQMRVKEPDSRLIPDSTEPRKMRAADATKGEKGLYTIYTEGIDNDGDGKYNEDGIGGTNVGISFPHLFKYHGAESGLWAGQEEEIHGVLKFMVDHPEIALVMHYGESNFCMVPPKGGRKGETSLTALKIPRNYAGMLNADPDKTYSMEEVKELVKAVVPPGMEVDDGMIAGMLGLGAAVNPLPKDLKIYTDYSAEYKKFLKKQEYSAERTEPSPAKDGSFELWVYYHLGLPSFSQDFWGVPVFKPAKTDSISGAGSMKNGSPGKPGPKAADPEKTFLQYNDSILAGKGFVTWTPFQHPQLGAVEIGGIVPFADRVPLPAEISKAIEAQVPWIYELANGIPKLQMEDKKIKPIGEGIFQLEVWISNAGKFPFPMAMGDRNKVPPPAIAILQGKDLEFLEGKERTVLGGLEPGQKQKISWLIRTTKSEEVHLTIDPVNALGFESTINLGGK